MRVTIKRCYYPNGTNGILSVDGSFECCTIELPFKDNKPRISCIAEGEYTLVKRKSPKFGWTVYVMGTQPARDLILFHAANDAKKELNGCIAPVQMLTGDGLGLYSKLALVPFQEKVFAALERGEEVTLKIHS